MIVAEYFKKELEKRFLHSKVGSPTYFQTQLNEEFEGVVKMIEDTKDYIKVEFTFEDKTFTYKLIKVQGKLFTKISEINFS